MRDADAVLARLSARFGRPVAFAKVFIDYVEGSLLFPERSRWRDAANYPALRPVDDAAAGYPCAFLADGGLCGIYDDRPQMCRDYRCDHLQKVIEAL